MEKLIERGLLFDYYGGLLNEKNRSIYEAAAIDDMSLSEIAEEVGISRQAVSDTLKRTDDKLKGFERELHLIRRAKKLEAELAALKSAVNEDVIDREKLLDIITRIEEAV